MAAHPAHGFHHETIARARLGAVSTIGAIMAIIEPRKFSAVVPEPREKTLPPGAGIACCHRAPTSEPTPRDDPKAVINAPMRPGSSCQSPVRNSEPNSTTSR